MSKPSDDRRRTGGALSDLFRHVIDHIKEIVRAEVELARRELRQEIREARKAGMFMGAAAVAGVFAAGFLLLGTVYALSLVLPPWAAAGSVGVVLGLASAACFLTARRKFKELQKIPEQTIETVKDNVEWIKRRVS